MFIKKPSAPLWSFSKVPDKKLCQCLAKRSRIYFLGGWKDAASNCVFKSRKHLTFLKALLIFKKALTHNKFFPRQQTAVSRSPVSTSRVLQWAKESVTKAEKSSWLKLPDVALNYIHESQKIGLWGNALRFYFYLCPWEIKFNISKSWKEIVPFLI